MTINETKIKSLLVIIPQIFEDERGHFYEQFSLKKFQELTGTKFTFVQDNQSLSKKDVVRGLHFQVPPHSQGKLVYVTQGKALDVAVDLRTDSKTYGKHETVILSVENKKMLWIPPGFAHGFAALEDNTILNYKCTDYYHPECEKSLLWNDTDLQIDWRINSPLLSKKDTFAQPFADFISPFKRDDYD